MKNIFHRVRRLLPKAIKQIRILLLLFLLAVGSVSYVLQLSISSPIKDATAQACPNVSPDTGSLRTRNVGQEGAQNISTMSLSNVNVSGPGKLLLVAVHDDDFRSDPHNMTVRYGGTNLTYVAESYFDNDTGLQVWYLANPPTGTNNVTVDWLGANADGYVVSAMTYSNVSMSDPIGDTSIAKSPGNNWTGGNPNSQPNVTVNAQQGGSLIVGFVTHDRGNANFNAGSGVTERYNLSNASSIIGAGGDRVSTGAGNYALPWTVEASFSDFDWVEVGVELLNAGCTLSYSITGNVYVDTNRNGTKDTGEINYQGATVNRSGGGSSVTNSGGNYSFTSVPAGNYTITLTAPAGYTATTTNPRSVTVGPNTTANFGIVQGNTISGSVYVDSNKNRTKDAGESNLDSFVTISASAGNVTSNSEGIFSIQNVPSGNVTVSLTSAIPQGYTLVNPLNGPPPSFQAVVGASCSTANIVPSSPGAACSAGSITNLNFGITNSIPWIQIFDLNARSDSGFTNIIPEIAAPTPTSAPTPTTPPAPTGTVTNTISKAVNSSSDDAEENLNNNNMFLDENVINLGTEGGVSQLSGFRFTGITIPKNATITNAYVTYSAGGGWSGTSNLVIKAEKVTNSSTYSSSNKISTRTLTTASTSWNNLSSWAGGNNYNSPNISGVVQEIVNQTSWASGNALNIIVSGTGNRGAAAYEQDPSRTAKLTVTYSTGAAAPTPTSGPAQTFNGGVNSSTDDAEENQSSGAINTNENVLNITDAGATAQLIGLRFTNTTVPKNATIIDAYISFRAQANNSGAANFTIRGEKSANSVTFSSTNKVSTRTTTTASKTWSNLPNFVDLNWYDTADMANVVQEIVNQTSWASGNPMTFIITGTGQRNVSSGDTSNNAPQLTIVYSGGGGGASPTSTPVPTPGGGSPTTISRTVPGGTSDAEENLNNNTMFLDENVINNGTEGGVSQLTGYRFTNITVPKNATITNAQVIFNANGNHSGSSSLTLRAEEVANSAVFSSSNKISTRPTTSASTNWNSLPTWNGGTDYTSPNFSGVVQEVVNQSSWASGNALTVIVSGTGERGAAAYEQDPARAASLSITYNIPAPTTPPAPTPTRTPTPIPSTPPAPTPTPTTPPSPSTFTPYALAITSVSTTPGVLYIGNGSSNFGNGQVSATNWLVGGSSYPEVFPASDRLQTSYSYISETAALAGIVPADLATDPTTTKRCINGISNCTLPANMSNGVFIANGNLILNAYTFPAARNYVILVNGNLTIRGNLIVPTGSTVIFAVSGNITIDSTVGITAGPLPASGQLQGFFSAGNSFIVQGNNGNCTAGADRMLNIDGAIIANANRAGGNFTNQRDLCGGNLTTPSFTVRPRLDMILNTPEFLMRRYTIFNEETP